MKNYKFKIPIHRKFGLTVEEASEYSGIGRQKLRDYITNYPDASFILHKGSQVIIKRPQFVEWLNTINYI